MEWTIRAAAASDVPALLELYAPYLRHLEESGLYFQAMPDVLPKVLETRVKSPLYCMGVAEREGRLGGFVVCSVRRTPPEYSCEGLASSGYLHDVYVAPFARRGGLAGRLVDYAEAWLAESGIAGMELEVLASNEGAQAFWEAQGARPVATVCYKKIKKGDQDE